MNLTAMTPNEIVAHNIVRLREDTTRWGGKRLSRAELARRCGWSDTRLYDLEWGRDRRPGATPNELYVLTRALDASLFELLLPPQGVRLVESDGPENASLPVWSVDTYSLSMFGMPRKAFEPAFFPSLKNRVLSRTLRRQVLAYHPDVREGTARIEKKRDVAVMMITVARIKSEIPPPDISEPMSRYDFDRDAQVEELGKALLRDAWEATDGFPGWDIDTVTVNDAFARTRELSDLLDKLRTEAIDDIEDMIVAGLIPEPHLPGTPDGIRAALKIDIDWFRSQEGRVDTAPGVDRIAQKWLDSIRTTTQKKESG